MEVSFKILRQQPDGSPYHETFTLDVEGGNTILDCLNRIKWELDGTLAFRKNCRNTICGSCSMKINGRSALACKENVASELTAFGGTEAGEIAEIEIAPLGNLPIVRDLIVDMKPFWDDLERIQPYISTASRAIPEREFLQTPEERDKLNSTGNCIMCGACYSECNAKAVNPDFVGPHALAKARRTLVDSRDGESAGRLQMYNEGTAGVWGCTRCYFCNAVCPMEVAPMDQIGLIKQEILADDAVAESRSIRHRKVLVELVKEGGWIDERKFGIYVVGNYFRDLRGLAGLAPLGLRMLVRGKFPTSFERSAGTEEVRGIIEAVQEKKERSPS
jgi:succinate dehydrogenase / fumarate reductase iron-sulfur subunit